MILLNNLVFGEKKPVELTQVVNVSSSSTTASFNYDATGGNRLVVAILLNRDAAVRSLSSVTINGVAGTIIETASNDTGIATSGALAYWLQSELPASTGSYNLVQNWNLNDYTAAGIWQLQNVNQGDPINFSNSTSGTQWLHNTSKSISNSGGEGLFTLVGNGYNDDDVGYSGAGMTHPSGTTERYDRVASVFNRFALAGADEQEKGAGSVSYSWTNTRGVGLDSWVIFTATINPE